MSKQAVPPDVVISKAPRKPEADPTLGVPGVAAKADGEPPHRLVTIGDSLTHGFQSGSVFHTDVSYPAIVAYELGCLDGFRYPRYDGVGGLPLNIELLLRDLERFCGNSVDWWEVPEALFRARQFLDGVEDYWERGSGSTVTRVKEINHNLAVYGWDLRDALSLNGKALEHKVGLPKDNMLRQIVENNNQRAAMRVYPMADGHVDMTLFDAAATLGAEHGDAESGIETLVVFLGANNVLGSVVSLAVRWTGDDYADPSRKGAYTVWRPDHFAAELAEVAAQVRRIHARHVIWCTVPNVTIAPLARGVGTKVGKGSRYFPYYTRPWITDTQFDPTHDPHLTADEVRAVDSAIDQYNGAITDLVRQARGSRDDPRDWYLFDVAGLLDQLAYRRYVDDPLARPEWWQPYELPPQLRALDPVPDSRFLAGAEGRRTRGGLFSLDGVHPTTIGYGIVAQELINVMNVAGVEFRRPDGTVRRGPVNVDFDRLLRRDTLVATPPGILDSTLAVMSWADEALDLVRRALSFGG